MQRILVGYDASPQAEKALALAVMLARATGAKLALAYVVPPIVVADAPAPQLAELIDQQQAWGERMLQQAAERLRAQVGPVETLVKVGGPGHELAEAAGALGADLVVVGSHGRGVLGRALLGSVATRVLHQSPVSVLVVP